MGSLSRFRSSTSLSPAIMVLLALLAACGGDSAIPTDTGPGERVPTSIQFEQGTVTVPDGSSVRISVTVRDQNSQAFSSLLQAQAVTWSVGDPSVASVQAVVTGLQADLTGEHPGTTQVTASIGSINAQASVIVSPVATQLGPVSGEGQTGTVGTLLDEPVVVRVSDRHGNGVPGIVVTFVITAGGGTLSASSATTSLEGRAGVGWTLGPAEGEQTVRAEVAGLVGSTVEFSATATSPGSGGPTGVVEGVVTAANGTTPIQGALVRLASPAPAPPGGSVPGFSSVAAGTSNYEGPEATTDNEGRFVLEGVPVGPQLLVATRGVFQAQIPVLVVAGATVEAAPLALDATGRLAYVPGEFDDIQSIVRNELGTELDEIDFADLANPAVTSQYRFIFINCGADFDVIDVSALVDNLRNYLASGGALYVSDLELWLVEALFPGDVQGGADGDEGGVTAEVVSPTLRDFLPGNPQTVNIMFNLDGWDAVTEHSALAEVLLRGNYDTFDGPVQNGPLAIAIEHGDGQLVYTSFHNNAAATADQVGVLMYFIYGFGDSGAGGAPALELSRLRLDSSGATYPGASTHGEHRPSRTHRH